MAHEILSVVGTSARRVDAVEKVTGRGQRRRTERSRRAAKIVLWFWLGPA
jgi:hypothetical protein